jgi:F420-non-reducing hydrogenase iron-sulfur subunit
MTEEFNPKIIAFCCNWCSYAGADLAGVSRFQYPSNVRIIRVMCSGRVDITFVIEALRQGADGVIVTGCHPNDCHYIDGNKSAALRAEFLSEFLEEIGIEPERFRLEWIAGSEGEKFARVIDKMVEDIRALGPLRGGEQ